MSLRVLMFGWELPPHNSGGLGTACEGLGTALTEAGVETLFVLPERVALGRYNFPVIFAGEPAIRTIALAQFSYLQPHNALGQYGTSLLDEVQRYAARARLLAQSENFDLIHAHDWLAIPAGLAARAVSGKPLIVHVHATEFDRGGGNGVNAEVYRIEREGLHQADGVIAVSEWTKQLLVKHYGIKPEKVNVVHNGINVAAYGGAPAALEALRAAGSKIILFVGRITLQKGPDYFVWTAKRVLEHAPETYFVMVGTGDMTGQVIQLAASLGITDRFFFPGFLRGKELERLYRSADLYILPSVSEPFGITPLESLACGTPVMVSKQSGVSEVISHALKVDFWDVDEMTNQILAVLRYSGLRQTLADYGRAEVQKVTWLEAARKCLQIYQTLAPV